jgi:hypothetical protein
MKKLLSYCCVVIFLVAFAKGISDMKDYLIAFDKNARKLSAESNDLEFILRELKKTLPANSRGEILIKANIQMRYLKREKKMSANR